MSLKTAWAERIINGEVLTALSPAHRRALQELFNQMKAECALYEDAFKEAKKAIVTDIREELCFGCDSLCDELIKNLLIKWERHGL